MWPTAAQRLLYGSASGHAIPNGSVESVRDEGSTYVTDGDSFGRSTRDSLRLDAVRSRQINLRLSSHSLDLARLPHSASCKLAEKSLFCHLCVRTCLQKPKDGMSDYTISNIRDVLSITYGLIRQSRENLLNSCNLLASARI